MVCTVCVCVIQVLADGRHLEQPVAFDGEMMRVQLPYPGTFCAFSSPEVEDICQVRMHVFAQQAVPRDAPCTIRVHLCPAMPNEEAQMKLADASEWGAQATVGTSHVMSLYQGTTLGIRFQDQTARLVWIGVQLSTTFTFVPPTPSEYATACSDGRERARPMADGGLAFCETVHMDVLPGMTRRASRTAAVAKRAGLSPMDNAVPLTLMTRRYVRPGPPAELKLQERTPTDFVLSWLPPAVIDGEEPTRLITHYSLELSVTGRSGT